MIETLTQLQHSQERTGPFALYIYEAGGEFHTGKQWFENVPRYPDEQISTLEAKARVERAIAKHRDVRICDRGDMLVFHSEGGKIIFGEKFWGGNCVKTLARSQCPITLFASRELGELKRRN